jgi:hypothetical protein
MAGILREDELLLCRAAAYLNQSLQLTPAVENITAKSISKNNVVDSQLLKT